MIPAPSEPGARDFRFTDEDFRALARLARAEFGLSLAESKKPLVYSRLARRLRAREISRFQDYMALLGTPDAADERLELISALTTNVTSFFREKHHFETLRQALIPDFPQQSRVRIWSAGCSSGQEPFSIAMTILDALPDAAQRDIRILATDIDPAIVRRAKAAQYTQEEVETIPSELRRSWIGLGARADQFEMAAAPRQMISFAELNLIDPWPFHGPFDAIFCRNVAIYFDQDTQQTLWGRFATMLRDDGFLFIGHSERVSGPALQTLATAGVTTYRKKPASGGAVAT
ncbi:protein-glutamate O-methyltransferase CheR [Salipiger sp. P9]|uniref:CheR family methyltransferase n=1 Tax=Salipiger pentaromativorans TaxID=2943193 RepID=UPI0021576299|nr:protein-glutamate O-methyltransferase CheR [Salipiger pentaromativorans]MCR8549802.1 protein-glutamate O-methyltransferase CheR [Salipiger pentaromativorans]